MSSIQYNPNPPRVWSRVQNRCSTDTASSTVDYARIDYERQMLLKGNILQYKKNSSNLTKNQRYTQIAKGMWTNRTKTWATQSETYTNPNNSSLLRVNNTILDPSNNSFSSRSNPFNCPTTEIPDGGNLVCNVVVDPCTQEVIKRTLSQQLCNPTTDSDVPGQIQELCWNDGTQTWYPRQRYTMGNSGTSWPEGYKGFVSALTPAAPVLILDLSNNNSVTLSWTAISNDCIPITSFNIYQNGILIANVLYPINTITISNSCGSYSFYVTSLSSDTSSEPSNIVSYSNATNAPTVSLTYNDPNSIYLSWNLVSNTVLYNIYQIGVGLIDSTTSTNATISIECGSYSYYVTSLNNGCESEPSSPPVSYTNTINAPTGLSYSSTSTVNQIILSWNSVSNATYYNIYNNGSLDSSSNTNSTTISNLYGSNTFTVTACIISDNCQSTLSNSVDYVATQYTTTGTISNNGKTITFTSNGTITFLSSNINTNITCVGGGGGGGGGGYGGSSATTSGGGGGGGGGEIKVTNFLSEVTTYSVVIGGGAIGGIFGDFTRNGEDGGDGGSSYITGGITTITSIGGFGGFGALNGVKTGGAGGNGGNGGAGGIGGAQNTDGSPGNNGGGGGGGGYTGKSGGSGSTNSIVSGYGSGGGGGGSDTYNGGIGGTNAGNGSQSNSNGTSGIANKGGGGGGGKSGHLTTDSYSGGNGGSGVVIINLP